LWPSHVSATINICREFFGNYFITFVLQILSITPAEKAAAPAVIEKKEVTLILSSFAPKADIAKEEPKKEDTLPTPTLSTIPSVPIKSPEAARLSKLNFFSSFFKKSQGKTPEEPKKAEEPKQKPQIPLASSLKKSIPDSAREHFEASSAAFLSLAQKKDQKNEEGKMDEWDVALLLGQYPGGKTPIEIKAPTREEKTEPKAPTEPPKDIMKEVKPETQTPPPPAIKVPSKPAYQEQSPLAPTLVTDPERGAEKNEHSKDKAPLDIKSLLFKKSESSTKESPLAIKTLLNSLPFSQKTGVELVNPESKETPADVSGNIIIPNQNEEKPPLQVPEKPVVPGEITPISNALAQKIIQNQVAEVFSDAPFGVRSALEKIRARDFLQMEDPEKIGVPGNADSKKRLSEYIRSLKNKAEPVIGLISEPGDTETSIDYIKRIVPIITKDDAAKPE
jgi:hypothetical protein